MVCFRVGAPKAGQVRLPVRALFKVLGVVPSDFEMFKQYFESPPGPGQPSRLDAAGRLALALRWLKTMGNQDEMCIFFGTNKTVISRELWPALFLLRTVLMAHPASRCRLPTKEEADGMEEGLRAQWGDPPYGYWLTDPCVTTLDGTVTPVNGCGSEAMQRLYAYRGGYHAYNNVFWWDAWGCIIGYAICAPGTTHDARLGQTLLVQQASLATNPDRIGLIVDNGLESWAVNRPLGQPQCFRPAKGEEARKASPGARAWSRWVLVRRQMCEWGNGHLKRTYPRMNVAMDIKDVEKYRCIMECCIHLS